MSALDDAVKFYYDCGKYQQANEARAELAALRSAASERDVEVERAVMAEREACNKAAQKAINKINLGTARARDWTLAELKLIIATDVEAAIRARGEGAK